MKVKTVKKQNCFICLPYP